MKVTFMGAGSTVFSKNLLGDTMLCEEFHDVDIALYDIDGARLEESYLLICKINEKLNQNRASVKKYLGVENRKEALRGAATIRVPYSILRFPRSTDFARPLPTPSASAVSSAVCAPFTCSRISHATSRRSAPTRGSSTIPTPWQCSPDICSVIPTSKR